jgi:hypothetical protein
MRRALSAALGLCAMALIVSSVAVASSSSNIRTTGSMSASPGRAWSSWRSSPISTTATTYRSLGGLRAKICSTGEVAATVSVYGAGPPLGLQVRIDDGALLEPGAVRFSPTPSGSMASFTFLISTSAFEANDHHVLQVEWRSITGRQTWIRSATLNLIYQLGTHGC